jgi:hypothetical protein
MLRDLLRHPIQRMVVLSALPALLVAGWLAAQDGPDYRNWHLGHHTMSAGWDDLGHNPASDWDAI